MAFSRVPLSVRLERKTLKTDGCWFWSGYKFSNGYGELTVTENGRRRKLLAHRVAYEVAYGPFDTTKFVCHTCDMPACVRPDHLFLGSAKDNMQDMIRKGRQKIGNHAGAHNGNTRLTVEQISEIKTRYKRGSRWGTKANAGDLAAQFGVTVGQVHRIISGLRWR